MKNASGSLQTVQPEYEQHIYSVKNCLEMLKLYKEIEALISQPMKSKCFFIEARWMSSFNQFGQELIQME